MEQARKKIEQTVRKCTDRLGFVTEEYYGLKKTKMLIFE